MKNGLLISIPALIVTGIVSVFGVYTSVNSVPTPTVQANYSAPVAVSKPLQERVEIAPQTNTIVAETPVVEPPTVLKVPTNEELKVKYGWTMSPYLDSINMLITFYPQFFTDEMREYSFKYIQDSSPSVEEGYIAYFYMGCRRASYDVRAWIDLGKKAGVDTSRYE